MTPLQRGRLAFSATFVVFFALTLFATSQFRLTVAGYFPGFAAGLGLIVTTAVFISEIREVKRSRKVEGSEDAADPDVVIAAGADERLERLETGENSGHEETGAPTENEAQAESDADTGADQEEAPAEKDPPPKLVEYLRVLAWLAVGVSAIALVGLPAGTVILLVAFLRVEGKEGWLYILIATAVMLAFLYGTQELFRLDWPPSLLFN